MRLSPNVISDSFFSCEFDLILGSGVGLGQFFQDKGLDCFQRG